jgi:hypothetical protein
MPNPFALYRAIFRQDPGAFSMLLLFPMMWAAAMYGVIL